MRIKIFTLGDTDIMSVEKDINDFLNDLSEGKQSIKFIKQSESEENITITILYE